MGRSQLPTSGNEFDRRAEALVMNLDQAFEVFRQVPYVLHTGFGNGAVDDVVCVADKIP